jgi:transcriptional regulator with XRE-family HTH domain
MTTLGERMRAVRRLSGYTLRDVTARCGVSIGHQSDIERDACNASVDVLERLADVYGLTLCDLLRDVRINGPVKLDYVI